MTDSLFHGEEYLRALLDAFPSPVLIADADLSIHDANRAARDLASIPPETPVGGLCGELLRCLHTRMSHEPCGGTDACADCALRRTVEAVYAGRTRLQRRTAQVRTVHDGETRTLWFRVTGAPLRYAGADRVVLTLDDVTELVELRRIIPVCSHCHKVRDDSDFWREVEEYLQKCAGVQLSHGICPDCMRKHYPEDARDVLGDTGAEQA